MINVPDCSRHCSRPRCVPSPTAHARSSTRSIPPSSRHRVRCRHLALQTLCTPEVDPLPRHEALRQGQLKARPNIKVSTYLTNAGCAKTTSKKCIRCATVHIHSSSDRSVTLDAFIFADENFLDPNSFSQDSSCFNAVLPAHPTVVDGVISF